MTVGGPQAPLPAALERRADELTVVSWGGAYQNSQIKAYSEPYAEATGVTFVWDESSAEAVAKLRAMSEAGNVTWDVVDVVAEALGHDADDVRDDIEAFVAELVERGLLRRA